MTQALYDIPARPQYAEILREEAVKNLKHSGGIITRPFLNSLKRIDSFIKECQRCTSPDLTTFQRQVLKLFTLSDGKRVPSLTKVEMTTSAMNVIGNFYHASQFPDGIPDRKYIDEEYSDTPVLIREVSCHKILVNSAGLACMGISSDIQDPRGGYYIRRPDGELTGEIVETAAQPVWNSIPKTSLHYVRTALTLAIRECHRYGITSAQEASAKTLLLHAAKDLEDENRFDLDL
ncbi:hypothetical protein BDV19DRAFT_392407 [Aspergillus venezuelensis]